MAQDTQPKHIISIGTDGFGWSGLGHNYEWDKDESGVKDHEQSESSLKLNYSFVFPNRLMIGAELSSEASNSKQKFEDGTMTKDEDGKSELDFGYSGYYLSGGRRISLSSWGLKNVSYNPTIAFGRLQVSGDAEDLGLERVSQARFEFIKIDILF
jgi:hypothetical protein